MRGLINIQNNSNEFLSWCLVRYLNPVNKTSTKVREYDKKVGKQPNFKGVEIPVHQKDYGKIERQNDVSINVFGLKIKNQIACILLESAFIYYYYQILKISIIF